MINKSNLKISKKQKAIVDTAEELFFRYGIKRITVGEICQKAGVSRRTFYKYFPNKDGLVTYLSEKWISEGDAALQDFQKSEIAFSKRLQALFDRVDEIFSKMSMEFLDDYISVQKQISSLRESILQLYVDAQERGDIRSDIRPELLLAAGEKLWELMRDEKLQNYYSNPAELAREISHLFYLGSSGTIRSDSDK